VEKIRQPFADENDVRRECLRRGRPFRAEFAPHLCKQMQGRATC
jgi:hypothetical protein